MSATSRHAIGSHVEYGWSAFLLAGTVLGAAAIIAAWTLRPAVWQLTTVMTVATVLAGFVATYVASAIGLPARNGWWSYATRRVLAIALVITWIAAITSSLLSQRPPMSEVEALQPAPSMQQGSQTHSTAIHKVLGMVKTAASSPGIATQPAGGSSENREKDPRRTATDTTSPESLRATVERNPRPGADPGTMGVGAGPRVDNPTSPTVTNDPVGKDSPIPGNPPATGTGTNGIRSGTDRRDGPGPRTNGTGTGDVRPGGVTSGNDNATYNSGKPRSREDEPPLPPGENSGNKGLGGGAGSPSCFGLGLSKPLCLGLLSAFPIVFAASLFTMEGGSKLAPPEFRHLPGEVLRGLLGPSQVVAQQALGSSLSKDATSYQIDARELVRQVEERVRQDPDAALGPTLSILIEATNPASLDRGVSSPPIDRARAAAANAALRARLQKHYLENRTTVDALRLLRRSAEHFIDCQGGSQGIVRAFSAYDRAIPTLNFSVGTHLSSADLSQRLGIPDRSIAEFVFVTVATKKKCPGLAGAGLLPLSRMEKDASTIEQLAVHWM